VEVQKQLVHKEEKLSQFAKRLQRLEEAHARQNQEDEDKWRWTNFDARHHHHRPQSQHSFAFVKLPSFSESNDPSLYLDWEAKVEHLFHVYKVTEDQKVRLAFLVFLAYANQWWHKLVMDIGLNKRLIVVSWYDLKACMRMQFVPSSYRREHLLKLQRLHQGYKTVDEYFKDLETSWTKMNMHDNDESKIVKFVSGLRKKIKNLVELHEYSSLKKMVHLTIKVESQLLKKTTFKHTHDDGFYNSSRKDANKISTHTSPSNYSKETTSPKKVSTQNPSTPKSPTKTSSTKYFKCLSFGHITATCPNTRTIKLQA